MDIQRIEDWGLGLSTPLLISGPCSAESPEQVMETAKGVAQHGTGILRAGIWKPRTRPNSFEGVGTIGLKWLKAAGKETGIPVCTEVANVKHVYEALRAGIDIMWVGARTTTNPFAVQEIADALEGVDVPVMVKNPISPDLKLWIGAMERLQNAGIKKIAAIHRGFAFYGESKYRNKPQWEIPIELKRHYPQLQVICDPSHICGRRDILAAVSQKAYDLNFDGLMLESHPNPDKALSDAKQQVTPKGLGAIMSGLVRRDPQAHDPQEMSRLESFRELIDDIDYQLIDTLASRMKVVREIGKYKRDKNITILQADRWNEIIRDRLDQGTPKGLSEDLLTEILQLVHKESIRHQTKIMNEGKEVKKGVEENKEG
ncbi:MAG: bifunctional 3-deoxy-7-phosphoheptulonate synthase/chorismate mutase type II [Bacteroidota bacterium]